MKNLKLKLLYAGLIMFVMGCIFFFAFLPIPFGLLFETSFYISITGLLVFLFTICFILFKQPSVWKKIVATMISFITVAFALIFIIIIIDFRIFFFQGLPPNPTKAQWREDLNYLSEEIKQTHPNMIQETNRIALDETVNNLNQQIDVLSSNEIIFEFSGILSSLKDAHSLLANDIHNPNWHIYPMEIYFFGDKLYITGAGRSNTDLIGSKLLEIGGHTIAEIDAKFSNYISYENKYGLKNRCGVLISEWLKAAGFIKDVSNAIFKFEGKDGLIFERKMKPIHFAQYGYWTNIRKVNNEIITPVIPNDRKENYWVQYQPDKKLIYFQFNKTIISEDKSLEQLIQEIDQWVETKEFNAFVIDLRMNTGGNAGMIQPLADYLINNKKINQKGKFFVLIGRKTFSGGILFASIIRNNSKALFVGEPTGQGQRYNALPKLIFLPNSKLRFAISTAPIKMTVDLDTKPWIYPDLPVEYSYQDFVSGQDPLIDTVMNYKLENLPEVKLGPEVVEKLIGRYLYSAYQILEISKHREDFTLSISDYNPRTYSNIGTSLYPLSENEFVTDIPELSCQLIKDNKVLVKWGNNEKLISKLDEKYMLPIEYLNAGRIEEAIHGFRNYNSETLKNMPRLEASLNNEGYKWAEKENYNLAIEVFKLNTELFPESWNAWDSMGEAYLKTNNKELAIKAYQRSVDLNPNNLNGLKILEGLRKSMADSFL